MGCSSGWRGGASLLSRPGFVDLQGRAVDFLAVETGDRSLRFRGVAELDEAEALRFAAGALGGHLRRDDRAERCEQIVQLGIGDLLGETSYIEVHLELLTGRAGLVPS